MAKSKRPTIKEKLSDTRDAWKAVRVMDQWKKAREFSRNLPKAVIMFDALSKGDVGPLMEYFPLMLGIPTQAKPTTLMPLKHEDGKTKKVTAPKIEYEQRSEEEEIDGFLDSLGL